MRKVEADAWRRLRNGQGMAARERAGLVGMVRTFEATGGKRTGWHLHIHALVIHREGGEAMKEAGDFLRARWCHLVQARGFSAEMVGQDFRAVGQADGLPDYGTKTLRGWGMALEMAGDLHKKGRRLDRLTVPDLLAHAHLGDRWAALKYAEACRSLAGLRLLFVSKNSKKRWVLGMLRKT